MVKVSVILPFYNESACIVATVDAVLEYLKSDKSCEFIFVDDGSTDDSVERLLNRVADNSHISLISYPMNRGKGYAVKRGVQQATGDFICYLDSDLAYSLDHLALLVEKLHYCDVVIGCRNLVADSLNQPKRIRRISGYLFNLLSRVILNLPYRDMQAGLKGFRSYAAHDLFERQRSFRFTFDAELLYLAQQAGYQIGEIPARISEQHRDKISKVSLLQDSIEMLITLLKIRFQHSRRSPIPKSKVYV